MKYLIYTFDNAPELFVNTSVQNCIGINILHIYRCHPDINVMINDITKTIGDKYWTLKEQLKDIDMLIATNQYVNEHINNMDCRNIDFNVVNQICMGLTSFIIHHLKKQIGMSFVIVKTLNPINHKIKFNKNLLITRYGNVELRLINSFLFCDENAFNDNLRNVILQYNNEKYMYEHDNLKWTLCRNDNIETTIKIICTNAGFYFNVNDSFDKIRNVFGTFVNKYVDGIAESDYLHMYDTALPFFYLLKNKLRYERNIDFNDNVEFSRDELINICNGNSILILSAYGDKINESYMSGKLFNLRRTEENFQNIKLFTLNAFVSCYPNVPHNDWCETLHYYENEIDGVMQKNPEITIFACSCGCYGIPLCHYVYKKYNITSLYIGHGLNYYFGIFTNTNSFSPDDNKENYINGNLNGKFKNIEKIENNRYGNN